MTDNTEADWALITDEERLQRMLACIAEMRRRTEELRRELNQRSEEC
jgi:hypothetical protein